LQRHGLKAQDQCNEVLLRWAKKYQVKVIATNDVHYVDQQDSTAQDILLCLQTGKDYTDPDRMRFENNQFFLKSPQEMISLFADVPEALENTQEISGKVQPISLERDVLLPLFHVPEGFATQSAYLKHLTLTGAGKRYGTLTATLEARINYELAVIQEMGFPGYFLIVQDFIHAAKNLGVVVGPGRGSVAGSVVAYCIGITNIDPIHYDLLFERFLNPERVSMPDIDIDFDDVGRQKVINYVVEKYGRNQVAQIITFGSMGAKSSIRDVARVLGFPLDQSNRMAKLVPEKPGTTLAQAFAEVPELAALRRDLTSLEGKVLSFAETLEGSARHTGIHAAGIIIAPDNLIRYIPIKSDKNSDLLVTQYDGSVVESVGMLKMDFLGLKTLSIIKDALVLIEKNHGERIDIDKICLNDQKTFALYQCGDTIATFQFESEGMRQWLIKLQPSNLEDLIAMNALYRPGPMQFIPNFVARKQGHEKIEYAHPLLREILKNTYGIMVYQEQIIQTAQIMAGYTLGAADLLRRAMGKKKADEMAKQREVFVKGAQERHGIAETKALEVFGVMEKFAQYGFNRSHSAAYSVLAYQTAYLKAHYPAAYMASVLTHNQGDIDKITFFMDACKRQGIQVLGPDVNESEATFDVNQAQQIRFGLRAIKGVGEAAVEAIILERKRAQHFQDIFSFAARVNLKAVNKKTFESLSMAGAFDTFTQYHRRQYLYADKNEGSLIEKAIRYGQQLQQARDSAQQSLFTASEDQAAYSKKIPEIAPCDPYEILDTLKMEKEVVGFYISGHPLDRYKVELENFCNCHTQNVLAFQRQDVQLAGVITEFKDRQSKHGKPFGLFTVEDYEGTLSLSLFGEDFLKNQHMLKEGTFVYITGHVAERYRGSGLELRPRKLSLLSEIRDKMSKSLQLHVPIQQVNEALATQLEQVLAQYPGSCALTLILTAPEETGNVTCLSRSHSIYPSNEFFEAIRSIEGITYRLQA
jgi:DNA polymerase III subunit alpha